ncbi:MAG: hypothetical protein WC831_03465 [Parcubacteria group bacterium]
MTKKNLIHWLSVIVIGIALGFAIQFVKAWTEPSATPPNGNLGAPINTSINDQVKGNATQGKISAKDFCLNSDPTKCLSTVGGGFGGTPSGTIDGRISTLIWSGGATAGLSNSCTDEPPGFCRGLTPMCEGGWTVKQIGWDSSGGDNLPYCDHIPGLGVCDWGGPSGWVGYTAYTYTCVKD